MNYGLTASGMAKLDAVMRTNFHEFVAIVL